MDELLRAVAIEYDWPEAVPEEKKPAEISGLSDYTGINTSKAGAQFQLTLVGKSLLLQYQQQQSLPIFPASEAEFFTHALNTTIRFEKDGDARICSLTITQDGKTIKAER
jgi:hypothetical protein